MRCEMIIESRPIGGTLFGPSQAVGVCRTHGIEIAGYIANTPNRPRCIAGCIEDLTEQVSRLSVQLAVLQESIGPLTDKAGCVASPRADSPPASAAPGAD